MAAAGVGEQDQDRRPGLGSGQQLSPQAGRSYPRLAAARLAIQRMLYLARSHVTTTSRKIVRLTQSTSLRASSTGPSPADPDWFWAMMNEITSFRSLSLSLSGVNAGIWAEKPVSPERPLRIVVRRYSGSSGFATPGKCSIG